MPTQVRAVLLQIRRPRALLVLRIDRHAGERMRPIPAVPLTKSTQRKLARSTRQKGWEYCSVCGEGRYMRSGEKRSTGMCITCLRANPPELTAPYLCTLCGDTEPSHFAKKGRARCTTCCLLYTSPSPRDR